MSIRMTLIFSFAFFQCACQHFSERIEITREYIRNGNWNDKAHTIEIIRMRVKKDSMINLADLTEWEVRRKLVDDSSFHFFGGPSPSKGSVSKAKFYFNKENEFTWIKANLREYVRTIGDLEKGNWYKFSHLVSFPYFIYIYVDNTNNVHRVDVNLSNY